MRGVNSPPTILYKKGGRDLQPLLNIIPNFDAITGATLGFTYLGSERIITNQLEIREDKLNSAPVYQRESTKFDKNHTVGPGLLQNGKNYLAKIRVKLEGDAWSVWSPETPFTALRTPTLVFQNLQEEKYVYNNDILMSVIFQQEQGDRVETYRFILMDQNKVPLEKFPTRVPETNTPNFMQERIKNLIKGKLYYVGVEVRSTSGVQFFGYHELIPHFIAPSTNSIVTAKPEPHDGQVLVESFLKQTTGIQTTPYIEGVDNVSSSNYIYLEGEWVIIPPHRPLHYEKLGVGKSSDFVLKVWCKNVANGEFLKFITSHDNGVGLTVVKQSDHVYVYKEFLNSDGTGYRARYKSNVIPNLGAKGFYLYLKMMEFRADVRIELI